MLIVFAEKKSSCQLCMEHVMSGKLPSRRGQKATNVAVYNACQYHQMSTYYRIQYLFFWELGGFGTLITSAEARVDKAARPVIGDTMFSHSLAS